MAFAVVSKDGPSEFSQAASLTVYGGKWVWPSLQSHLEGLEGVVGGVVWGDGGVDGDGEGVVGVWGDGGVDGDGEGVVGVW